MSSAPQRLDGPAEPASRHVGWHHSRQGSGCRRAAVRGPDLLFPTSSCWSCCVWSGAWAAVRYCQATPSFQPF